MYKYFFPYERIALRSYPPKKKGIFTGLWNKNSMRFEYFLGFKESKNRHGYEAYRLFKRSSYNKCFEI